MDCGHGQTVVRYFVAGDKLTLELGGENTAVMGGDPVINFARGN